MTQLLPGQCNPWDVQQHQVLWCHQATENTSSSILLTLFPLGCSLAEVAPWAEHFCRLLVWLWRGKCIAYWLNKAHVLRKTCEVKCMPNGEAFGSHNLYFYIYFWDLASKPQPDVLGPARAGALQQHACSRA